MNNTNNSMFDGHVLATTLLPALLQQGYEVEHLRQEALSDSTMQSPENVKALMQMFDSEVERFYLAQVTESEMTAAINIITVMGVTPTSKKGVAVDYTPRESKGFERVPSCMSQERALRMLNSTLPETVKTYLRTFI